MKKKLWINVMLFALFIWFLFGFYATIALVITCPGWLVAVMFAIGGAGMGSWYMLDRGCDE